MTRRELFKEVNVKCLELQSKYRINCGGCCYVAAVLAELLTKYDIPYQVVYFDNWGCHYAIRVCDRYLNRDEFNKHNICNEYNATCESLYEEYYSNGCWNDMYDTRYNGIVKISLTRIFDKYGKRRNRRKTKQKFSE